MATKNNPGLWDCYAAADPDEPIFILRANDELAPFTVKLWAIIRYNSNTDDTQLINALVESARITSYGKPPMDNKKFAEAMKCADDMVNWKKSHGK